MLLRIHNAKLEKVAYIDNDKADTLHFYKDKWSRYLETGTSSFEFTVFKRSIKSDTVKEKAYSALTERAFVSFDYRGKTYLFNVMSTDETEHEITCYCENLNLELLNEYCGPYKATKAMSFVDYCNLFEILRFGAITVGKNEVEGQTRTIEWTGQDTDLKRLLSIANNFDAEIEFETHLKDDSSLKSFVMNIYKKHDENNQGVGRRREDVLLSYGKNISGVRRKIDKTGIYNAIKPTGKRTEKVTQTVKIAAKTPTAEQKSAVATWSGGDLKYGGNTLSKDTINTLLKYCVDYNVLPSGVISQLYVESFWGKSNVARVDRNWGGLTWTGTGSRPSGVTVTRGSARPANEGGYYMRFANLADYFKDYMYLIAKQGLYAVVGKKTIDDYTKGLFRVGGAKYDYAAAGHSHYITLMRDVRSGVNRNNNSAMDKLDKLASEGYSNTTTAPKTAMTVNTLASKTKSVLNELNGLKGRRIGSGQCYAIPAWYAMKIGGPWLGGGVTNGFRGLIKGGMAAGLIGDDYNWKQFGWQVVRPKKVADIIPGAIANIKINHNGGQIVTGPWGHTVVVKAVSGNTVTVLEQNYANRQFLEERNYTASTYLNSISTLCYPPEIASGKRIDGKASQPVASPAPAAPKEETKTETTEQEVVFGIDSKKTQEWKNEEGVVEFYLKNGLLYAPLSKNLYPSAFTGVETTDNWIRKDIEVDTDSEDKLISVALADLRKNCYPAITYEVTGYHGDLDIGDTIKITDSEYVEGLILEARVSEQHLSFTNPQNNATIFANFKALENELSDTLEARMEALAEMARPYELRLSTDKGTTFINQLGRSVLTPKLLKANKEHEADFIFKHKENIIGAGLELTVDGTDVDESLIVTVEAYIDNELVATQEVTFVNIVDDAFGVMGKDGIVHTAYANSPDGTEGFSLTDSNRDYLGIYTDNIPEDSQDPSKYRWSRIRGEDGKPGKGIEEIKTYYLISNISSGILRSTPGWTETPLVTTDDKPYLWTYRVEIYTDGTRSTSEPYVIGTKGPKGDRGSDGIAGKDGVGLRSTVVTYGLSTSSRTRPSSWTTSVPALIKGQYLWTRTVWNYTDGTNETGYQSTYIAKDGNNGTDGLPGKDGVGIRTTTITYQASTGGTTAPTGTWSASIPSVPSGQYLWTRTIWAYTDGTSETGYSVALMGPKGDRGLQGPRGIQGLQGPKGDRGLAGEPGSDGRTQYTHIAYADTALGGGFSQTDQNRAYIGMYQDFTATDSSNPSDYKWSKWKGSDGADGVPGAKGADGRTPYIHFAYAESADGRTGFSTTQTGNKRYLGTYTDYTQADSIDYRVYKWTLIKGADGNGISNVTNYYLATTASTGITRTSAGWTTTPQAITADKRYLWNYRVELYTNGISKTTDPAIIGVHGEKGDRGLQGIQGVQGIQGIPGTKGADGRTQYTHIAYADNATGGGFSQTDQTKAYIGMYQDFTETDSINPSDYRWTKWKGEDGAQGVSGKTGADGRTPYVHFAYANSADGRTDFSLTQTGDKRYIGHYTDFTEADSQDPTKYTWVDMVGTVEVGGVNLLPNADFSKLLTSSERFTVAGTTYTNKYIIGWLKPYNGGIPNPTTNYHAFVNETFSADGSVVEFNESNGSRNWKAISVTIPSKDLMVGTYHFAADLYATGTGTKIFFGFYYYNKSGKADFYAGQTTINVDKVGSWHRYGGTIKINDDIDFSKDTRLYVYGYGFSTNSILYLKKPKLEKGNIGTDFSLNPADIDAKIDAKADEKLTLEQLNALQALAQQNQAELEARATLDELSRLQVFLNDMQRQDETSREQTKADLRTLANRVATNVQRLGEMKQVTEFMTTYISQSEEGMVIGKKDSTSLVKVSNDKISFVSGGEEVAYISQGVLHIDNGVFATSVRIGHFITKAHPDNEFINMTYFVP